MIAIRLSVARSATWPSPVIYNRFRIAGLSFPCLLIGARNSINHSSIFNYVSHDSENIRGKIIIKLPTNQHIKDNSDHPFITQTSGPVVMEMWFDVTGWKRKSNLKKTKQNIQLIFSGLVTLNPVCQQNQPSRHWCRRLLRIGCLHDNLCYKTCYIISFPLINHPYYNAGNQNKYKLHSNDNTWN